MFEAFKSAPPSGVGAPEVSPSSPEPGNASSASAAQAEVSSASDAPEEQSTSTITPSGIEVYYSWAPRRHYKLRHAESCINEPWFSNYEGAFDWREVPSVTTVLTVLDKSGALSWWAQRMGIEGLLTLLERNVLVGREDIGLLHRWEDDDGLNQVRDVDAQAIVDLLVENKLSINHVKDKAADRGVNVHEVLDLWVSGTGVKAEDYPESERGYVRGLNDFLALMGDAKDVQSELMVGSLQHQYAGRFDLVLTLPKSVEVVTKCYPKKPPKIETIPAGRFLLDLKTSKRVYDTHYLQLEAYEAAAVECGYAPTDYRGVVHVTADGKYELCLNKDWTFEDFLSVRACYQTMHERKIVQALRDELGAKDAA